MSNDICVWKSNGKFRKENADSVFGELMEGDTKPEHIETTDDIKKFTQSLSAMYPPLESSEPCDVWSSSFFCSDYHFSVSMSYSSEEYVEVIMDMQNLCKSLGLTLYIGDTGEVFP